jgi:hypothetical protein
MRFRDGDTFDLGTAIRRIASSNTDAGAPPAPSAPKSGSMAGPPATWNAHLDVRMSSGENKRWFADATAFRASPGNLRTAEHKAVAIIVI